MIDSIVAAITEQAKNVEAFEAKLKLKIDGEAIMIDGTGESNVVSRDDGEADCEIIMDGETFDGLRTGSVNPMMAAMTGKVKIKGSMGLAMKLQSLVQ